MLQMYEGEIHETITDQSSWEKLKELLKSDSWRGVLHVIIDLAGDIVGTIFGVQASLLTKRSLSMALTALANEMQHN